MRLWKIISRPTYETSIHDGRLVCDDHFMEQDWRLAYEWMALQLTKRVVPSPADTRFPQWAWSQWEGPECKRPDLRTFRHRVAPGEYVRLTLEIDPDRVLLSDFDEWHFPLNNWYLPFDEADAKKFEQILVRDHVAFGGPHPPHIQNLIEASWHRIFDLGAEDPYGTRSKPEHQSIQATFWELFIDDVIDVTHFSSCVAAE